MTLLTKTHKHHPRQIFGARGLIVIGKQFNKQIANLHTYSQNQAETSRFHRAICQNHHTTPLRLTEQEVSRCAKTDQDKIYIWLEKPVQ